MADAAEPEPEPEPILQLGNGDASAAAPKTPRDAEGAEAAPLTEAERMHAAVAAFLIDSPEASGNAVLKAMKTQFPDLKGKVVKEAMAAHKAALAAIKRCSQGHLFGPCNPLERNLCDECGCTGTAYRCGSGCDWDICATCHDGDAATPEALTAAAATVAAMRGANAAATQKKFDQIRAVAKLAKGYGEFFNHISLRKEWRSLPFALADVEQFFAAAAVIVIGLRFELDASTPGVVKIRMLDGSAKEYLWGVESNPNPKERTAAENQKFVSELVHVTVKDANGYVEELTKDRVDAAIKMHGGAAWPWVGDTPPPSARTGDAPFSLMGLKRGGPKPAAAAATPLAGLFDATPGVVSSALATGAAAAAASEGSRESRSAGLGIASAASSAPKLTVDRADDDQNDEAVDAALAGGASVSFTNGAIDLD